MTSFVTDSFTDTNGVVITAHTGELGATWTKHASATNTGNPQIQSNKIQTTESAKNENYYASGSPASANYTFSLDYTYNGLLGNEICGPAARMTTGATNTGYFFIYFKNVSGLRLYKYVAGTLTQIGSTVSFAPVSGLTYRLTVDVSGTTIAARMQRLSDSNWISSAGAFGASQVNCISATDSAISAAGKGGFWFSSDTGSGGTRGAIDNISGDEAAAGATATTLTGPTSGTVGVASANFTAGANGTITGTVVVTPSDGGDGGTFSPTTVSISAGTPTGTFTYTAASTGAKTISTTNDGGLTNPSNITYTASSAAATAVTMSGPSGGVSGVASTNFTVGADGTIAGTVIVTPSDSGGGGTFTPTTVSISAGTPTGTFTYTPSSAGAKTISETNNGGLADASNITYTATSPALYTTVNTTDTIGAQNIMVLVPASGSAVPYNAANPTNVILYAHGSGETQTGLTTDSLKFPVRDALINAGYILAGTNARGNNWGNQASVDDYAALDKYVRDNYNVKNVCLWSQSMGGLDGLSAIAQGKIKVVGWLGTYPVCNLANLYSLGTYASAIDTAYGITGTGIATYANKTWGNDPALKLGFNFRHIPMRFYASSGDTVVPKANNTDVLAALVAGSCRESTVVACTGNHGDASHFDATSYLAFFARCFATPVAMGQPSSTRTVTITLTSDGTTPCANLTGLKWWWSDQITPDMGEYPTDKGSAATTDASGVLVIIVHSNLPAGGIGWLIVTNSDGTTTQIPAAMAFSGPVQVS